MFFAYILESKVDSGFYIGYTSDIQKRLREHNSGKTKSLRHRIPFELIYYEEFSTIKEAKAREKQFKSWKGGEALKYLLKSSPRLRRD